MKSIGEIFYHSPTKLQEGNVFSRVCLSFCLSVHGGRSRRDHYHDAIGQPQLIWVPLDVFKFIHLETPTLALSPTHSPHLPVRTIQGNCLPGYVQTRSLGPHHKGTIPRPPIHICVHICSLWSPDTFIVLTSSIIFFVVFLSHQIMTFRNSCLLLLM